MSADDSEGEQWSPHDDSLLRDHIANRAGTSARLGAARTVLDDLRRVWVLIFNPGMPNEGVYTLQGRTKKSSAYVLAFENNEDAERFAEQLQAEGFDLATPTCWESPQIEMFCEAGEFELSLVDGGTLITPPTKNEYDLDAFDRMKYGDRDGAGGSGGGGGASGSGDGHQTFDLRRTDAPQGQLERDARKGGGENSGADDGARAGGGAAGDQYATQRAALERLWRSGKGEGEGGAADEGEGGEGEGGEGEGKDDKRGRPRGPFGW